jgi:hypothetical protein
MRLADLESPGRRMSPPPPMRDNPPPLGRDTPRATPRQEDEMPGAH